MNSKENRTDLINSLGIGIFAYLIILKICQVIEFTIKNTLVITEANPKLIILTPKMISLFAYTLMLLWIVKKFDHLKELNTRKILITSIISFFIITLVYALINSFMAPLIMKNFIAEFDLYYDGFKQNSTLRGYTFFVPILRYLILAIILLTRRKSIVI